MTVRPHTGPPYGYDHRPAGPGSIGLLRRGWDPFWTATIRRFMADEHELGPRVAASLAVSTVPQHQTAIAAARHRTPPPRPEEPAQAALW